MALLGARSLPSHVAKPLHETTPSHLQQEWLTDADAVTQLQWLRTACQHPERVRVAPAAGVAGIHEVAEPPQRVVCPRLRVAGVPELRHPRRLRVHVQRPIPQLERAARRLHCPVQYGPPLGFLCQLPDPSIASVSNT